jgi:hypothetical protein
MSEAALVAEIIELKSHEHDYGLGKLRMMDWAD